MSSPAQREDLDNVVALAVRSSDRTAGGDLRAQQQKIAELLELADRCQRLAARARASRGAEALHGTGALASMQARIDGLERTLRSQQGALIAARAERDAMVRRLQPGHATPAPEPEPAPVPEQVLAEAKPVRGRQLLVWLAILGLLVGILAVINAFMTLVWQEPISEFFQARAQGSADSRLKAEETEFAKAPARAGEDPQERIERLALTLQRRKHPGDQLGRLTIPAIGLRTIFFEGAVGTGGEESLRKGAARYEDTRMPGIDGTVGIAGHRTTFGAPFRKVNELKPGNRIIVRMPYAKFTYVVEGEKIVSPTTLSVLKSSDRARSALGGGAPTTQKVVLTACHPIGSDAERIVVTGRLIRTDPIEKS